LDGKKKKKKIVKVWENAYLDVVKKTHFHFLGFDPPNPNPFVKMKQQAVSVTVILLFHWLRLMVQGSPLWTWTWVEKISFWDSN
jgi:hypothetical protein